VKTIKRNRRTARLLLLVEVLDVMDLWDVFGCARLQQIVLGHCRHLLGCHFIDSHVLRARAIMLPMNNNDVDGTSAQSRLLPLD
jgi:hypothetical protein